VKVENTKLALTAPGLSARLEFFIDIILPAELWLWSRPSLLTEMRNRNISWEVKTAGA